MAQCEPQGVDKGAGAALEAARRPDAQHLPHEQPEIQAADLQEHALEDVAVSAQVHPAQPPGGVEMRVGTFEAFTAPTQQPLPARAANPPPVGIHRVTGHVLPAPVAPAAVRLRHVAADPQRGQRDQRLIAVVALVADQLRDAGPRRQHRVDLFGGDDQRLKHRRRVAGSRVLDTDADHRARLQVHGMLGLVRQAGPAVLPLRDLRVRVLWMRPIVVGPLLRALAVQAGQFGARRRGDARRRRQLAQERFVTLARIPAHYASKRRIGFQRRRVDADRLAPDQAGVGQPLQHPREDRLVRLEVNPPARARHRRVVRRRLVQRHVQKLPQAQRIGGPPRNRPFRVQTFEVAEQQQPEVAARRQTRPADPLRLELRALRLDEPVEAGLVENTIHSFVERMTCAPRQFHAGHPHRRLPPATAAFTHCHGKKCSTSDQSCRSLSGAFTTGC